MTAPNTIKNVAADASSAPVLATGSIFPDLRSIALERLEFCEQVLDPAAGVSDSVETVILRATLNDQSGAVASQRLGGNVGYASLRSWPSLGDPPLATLLEQLAKLRPGEQLGELTDTHALVIQALRHAALDGTARVAGRHLLGTRPIPASHLFLGRAAVDTLARENLLERARLAARSGVRHLKLKVRGQHDEIEAETITRICQELPSIALRLDFNGQCSAEQVIAQLGALDPLVLAKIDLLEDPVAFQSSRGRSAGDPDGFAAQMLSVRSALGLRCAWDRGSDTWDDSLVDQGIQPIVDVLVVKPAITDVDHLLTRLMNAKQRQQQSADARHASVPSLLVTSYLGHPLEQMAAAYVAQEVRARGFALENCGLLGHERLDAGNPFVAALHRSGPHLLAVEGRGVGFDEQLGHCTFRPLAEPA